MNKNIFYTYLGSNGATYIFNLSTFTEIMISLEFYKPLGLKRNILKVFFTIYLFILNILSKLFILKSLKDLEGIKYYLSIKIDKSINFDIDNLSSIFISSTGDKVIVNHQNKYFEKFAFGKSYNKACHEVSIYKLLSKKSKYFLTSNIIDINIQKSFCSFKLYNDFIEKKEKNIDDYILADSLVDFFNINNTNNVYILEICTDLRNEISMNEDLLDLISKIEDKFKSLIIKVGLTHWDFKIWNIQAYQKKILIYDFEETKLDGLPLEDLYNYYIDPKIMANENTKNIITYLHSDHFLSIKQYYCNKLNIDTKNNLLLVLYLLNRIIFYDRNGGKHIMNRYLSLLDEIKKEL